MANTATVAHAPPESPPQDVNGGGAVADPTQAPASQNEDSANGTTSARPPAESPPHANKGGGGFANSKYSRRGIGFAEKVTAIEEMRGKITDPDEAYPDPKATRRLIRREIGKLRSRLDTMAKQIDEVYGRVDPEFAQADVKPTMESTTLWDFPTQSYGDSKKGDSGFQGVTPAFIIYNMIQRYTAPGDLVLDPMAGSGTTIDVCNEEDRRVMGFDISPTRVDIKRNDARTMPLDGDSVDMVFIDSPYGDNVDYSDDPENIGKLSAEGDEFYDALSSVARELYRVLKPGKVLGWLIGDQWVKRKFTPVGFRIYEMLTDDVGFEPVDLICVTRRNQSSNTGIWHYRAVKHNFYLRGFKNLIIVKKPEHGDNETDVGTNGQVHSNHEWQRYKPKLPSQLNGQADTNGRPSVDQNQAAFALRENP